MNVQNQWAQCGQPLRDGLVTLAECLREVPTIPLKESILVKDYLLIEDPEGQAMILRAARRPTLKRKAQ